MLGTSLLLSVNLFAATLSVTTQAPPAIVFVSAVDDSTLVAKYRAETNPTKQAEILKSFVRSGYIQLAGKSYTFMIEPRAQSPLMNNVGFEMVRLAAEQKGKPFDVAKMPALAERIKMSLAKIEAKPEEFSTASLGLSIWVSVRHQDKEFDSGIHLIDPRPLYPHVYKPGPERPLRFYFPSGDLTLQRTALSDYTDALTEANKLGKARLVTQLKQLVLDQKLPIEMSVFNPFASTPKELLGDQFAKRWEFSQEVYNFGKLQYAILSVMVSIGTESEQTLMDVYSISLPVLDTL
jgi:hypothetical protein